VLVLAIDTATQAGGAALAANGKLIGEVMLSSNATHSRRLLGVVEFLLQGAGRGKQDLDGIAVTMGPGYFTGLRIGLATAQGLSLGLDVPVAAVSTLRLLAASMPRPGMTIWAVLDARRGLVYAAPFKWERGELVRLAEDAAMSPQRLNNEIQESALLVGDGARAYADELASPERELAPEWAALPRPGLLALLGQERIASGQGLRPEEVRPRYCRPSDAEIRFGLPLDEYRLLD
jgi:tRNA threonylcarbamoyladenosine biosynthesis protein TsaB